MCLHADSSFFLSFLSKQEQIKQSARRNYNRLRKQRVYALNPEKYRAINRASYAKHREKRCAEMRQRPAEQRERKRLYNKQYSQAHKQELNAYEREWRRNISTEHKARYDAYHRAYRIMHRTLRILYILPQILCHLVNCVIRRKGYGHH